MINDNKITFFILLLSFSIAIWVVKEGFLSLDKISKPESG